MPSAMPSSDPGRIPDLPDLDAARGLFSLMRAQLMAGQFLDVVESVRPWAELPTAERLDRADR